MARTTTLIEWEPRSGIGRTADGVIYTIQRSAPIGERPFWGPAWFRNADGVAADLPEPMWPMGETLVEWRKACERHARDARRLDALSCGP